MSQHFATWAATSAKTVPVPRRPEIGCLNRNAELHQSRSATSGENMQERRQSRQQIPKLAHVFGLRSRLASLLLEQRAESVEGGKGFAWGELVGIEFVECLAQSCELSETHGVFCVQVRRRDAAE